MQDVLAPKTEEWGVGAAAIVLVMLIAGKNRRGRPRSGASGFDREQSL